MTQYSRYGFNMYKRSGVTHKTSYSWPIYCMAAHVPAIKEPGLTTWKKMESGYFYILEAIRGYLEPAMLGLPYTPPKTTRWNPISQYQTPHIRIERRLCNPLTWPFRVHIVLIPTKFRAPIHDDRRALQTLIFRAHARGNRQTV